MSASDDRFRTGIGSDLDGFRRAIDSNSFYRLDLLRLKLTTECNLRCLKCGCWHIQDRGNSMDRPPLGSDEWLAIASDAIDLGVKTVRFSGGEPTLHPSLVGLVSLFAKGGVRCEITTNGSRLAGGLGESLVRGGIAQINFSVDGASADIHDELVGRRGAFEQLEAGASSVQAAMRSNGALVSFTVSTVVVAENIAHLDGILVWAASRGCCKLILVRLHQSLLSKRLKDRLGVSPSDMHRYEVDILPRLIESGKALGVDVVPVGYDVATEGSIRKIRSDLLKLAPCFSAWTRATVFSSGDVFVCSDALDPRLRFGNVRDGTLSDVLRGPRAGSVRAVCHAPGVSVAACNDCDSDPPSGLRLARALGLLR